MKRSEVSIKTSSTPASLSFKGQATKHTTVKWSIGLKNLDLGAIYSKNLTNNDATRITELGAVKTERDNNQY